MNIGGHKHLHPTSNHHYAPIAPPLNFLVRSAGLMAEVTAKVPSWYYRVQRYFFHGTHHGAQSVVLPNTISEAQDSS